MHSYKQILGMLLLAVFALAATGCDSNGSEDDASIEGLWKQPDDDVYLRVAADEIMTYEHTPANALGNPADCYLITTFAILDVDEDMYTLRDHVFDQEIEVTMTRNGEVLTTVMTINGSPNTVRYNRSNQAVSSLQPGCS